MSRKRWTPIFHLLLVFLLAGDLGSHIFANANAIDCNLGWSKPSKDTHHEYLCEIQDKHGNDIRHYCKWCGRNDNKHPSASDCADPSGRPTKTKGSLDCDAGMRTEPRPPPDNVNYRAIVCLHTDNDMVVREYRCFKYHLNQQCPEKKCHI
ncbi:uncharacterized protein MELLADRAFT_124235 [Melampsora larici-populina 98AG31]|uniref:Secreted protein n=1 Tax=Melampsora larici-populina (strain 98AG31 / pathotype 3-4-7) TaxID=747676 RepID=F4RHN2_MELLP|nr:uncharacterized protein MELLADRAFT_124235 [Melampsora larici-populina 98AG31]EGG08104.1 secreted protein [Melampsora larici-populina 98AG31]